jgi:hypothetical protein
MYALLLLGSLLSFIVAFGMLFYAAVRRRNRRPIPALATYGGLVAFGATFSVVPIGYAREPLFILSFVVVALAAAGVLAATRRYRMAGALLLGLAVPSVLWWGWFIVADVVDPFVSYQLVLIGWFAQSLFVALLGVIGVVLGNRVQLSAHSSRDGPPEHRVMVISTAFLREIGLGPITYPEVFASAASLVVLIAVTTVASRLALPPIVGLAVAVPVGAAVAAELWYWALSRRLRHAMEGFSVLGGWEADRWRRTIARSIPTNPAAARRWLAANPESPQNGWARVELLAWIGDFDDARAVAARLPDTTPLDRFDRAVNTTFMDWVLTGNDSFEELREAAAAYGEQGTEERRIADAQIAYSEAQRAEAAGRDWTEPLIALRNRVDPQHRPWHRDMVKQRFRIGLIVLGSLGLVLLVLGGPPRF